MTRTLALALCILLFLTNLCFSQTEAVSPRVLTLNECLKLAKKHNATLIAARESYNVAKSDVWLGWGKLLPGVNSRLGYIHSETWSPGGVTITRSQNRSTVCLRAESQTNITRPR